ncbi:MAG: response regulator [Chloroflexi bacterium]|nr:response regulator [Chloroflexota bacterium]
MDAPTVPDLVLFVEDNPDFRESAASLLEVHGYEVALASDGLEALDILHQNSRKPDLIVSDIAMPRMNGYDFFHAVREELNLRDIPFIFLTAMDQDVQVRQGWLMGADQYVVKPFKPEDFILILNNRLKRSREITEHLHKSMEEKIEKIRHDLVQVVSHEIRTPLTYVKGGFDLLMEELQAQKQLLQDTPGIEEYIKLIQMGTTRLHRLADQTVTMTDISSGQTRRIYEQERGAIDMADLITTTRPLVEEVARQENVQLEFNVEPEIFILGVMDILAKAVSEIIRNAIVFSGPDKTVLVRAYPEADMGVIEVQDFGRGIREEDLRRVWEMMHQSERTDHRRFEQQGFGLGLPIAQQIIEIHHGSAILESAVGQGTTVWIKIPLY